MRLTWITDPHLNFLHAPQIRSFCNSVNRENPDAVVITGDISEAPALEGHLRKMEKFISAPIYFVCGNHDYYHGSIKTTRMMLRKQFGKKALKTNNCHWLNDSGVVKLSDTTALVGHDGWYDGGYGNYFASMLDMTDYHIIHELRGSFYQRPDQYVTIQALAKEAANHIQTHVEKALRSYDTVYFVTHVPPFRENSRAPDGSLSDSDWLPHFSSKIIGDALLDVMTGEAPEKKLIVLCGHTHTNYVFEPTTNIKCITGGATYRSPEVCTNFDI